MMSDSSLSDGAPSKEVLEQALRNAVTDVYQSGDLDNLTVKRIRKSVEIDLDLREDFFKNDPAWKDRSKNVIQSEVVRVWPICNLGLPIFWLINTIRTAKQMANSMESSRPQFNPRANLPKVKRHK